MNRLVLPSILDCLEVSFLLFQTFPSQVHGNMAVFCYFLKVPLRMRHYHKGRNSKAWLVISLRRIDQRQVHAIESLSLGV